MGLIGPKVLTDLSLIRKRHSSCHCREKSHCSGLARHLSVQSEEIFVVGGFPSAVNSAILDYIDFHLFDFSFDLGDLDLFGCHTLNISVIPDSRSRAHSFVKPESFRMTRRPC